MDDTSVFKKRSLLLTVDTEFSTHFGTVGVWGKIGGKKYGLTKIIEILNRHKLKATFFVDVYQKTDEMEKACDYIQQHGHDIQLHTHPNWLYDRNRENIQKYSFEEQCEIIAYGKEKLRQWTGRIPVAHRAGDFGANDLTLQALAQNQIECDLSYFWEWKDCNLNRKYNLYNQLSRINGVLEIPTTCFHSQGFGVSKTIRLIDINEPFSLLKELLAELVRLDYRTIVVVLHSFSLIQWNESRYKNHSARRIYWPNDANIHKLDNFFRLIRREKSLRICTVSEYFSALQDHIVLKNNPEVIPHIRLPNTLKRITRSIFYRFMNRFYYLPVAAKRIRWR